MELEKLLEKVSAFLHEHPLNYISDDDALRYDLVGMRIYDSPLFAVASAADPMFAELKKEGITHPKHLLPEDFLPGAKSVICYFLPFSEQVRKANALNMSATADEWLHGRIEGQEMNNLLGEYLKETLQEAGYDSAFPTTDRNFRLLHDFCSNWSERHVAYIAGLGTFGMSRGLITKRGIAGRFGSVITGAELPVTLREYADRYQWCSKCGKCSKNCPVDAIDTNRNMDDAKIHPPCKAFVYDSNGKNNTRRNNGKKYFGCGKCQVAVPCESSLPPGVI